MARKIIWSFRAKTDWKAILAYWNKRNQSNTYSRRLNRLFKESVKFLSEHPQVGRPTVLENIRVKVVRDYLLIYEI